MASNDFVIRIILDAQSKIAPVMAAASAEADKLRDRFKGADRAAEGLDKRMVQLEGHVSKARDTIRSLNPTLDALDRKAKGFSTTLTNVNRNMGVLERQSEKAGAALGSLGGLVERLEKKLNQLDRKMTEMGARTYKPKLDVETGKSEAQVDALSLKLLALERKRRTVRIGIEQEIIDREIAEVEAKLDKLEGGVDRYIEIKVALDEESERLLDEKAREQTRKFNAEEAKRLAARRRFADEWLADVRSSIVQEEDERIAAQIEGETRRHVIQQRAREREHAESIASARRIATEIAQIREDTDHRPFAGRGANAEIARLRSLFTEHTGIELGVHLSREDRARVEEQLAQLGLKRVHVKVLLDTDRNFLDRAQSQIQKWSQQAEGQFHITYRGLVNAALNLAIVFSEPLLSALTAVGGALVAVGVSAGQAAVGLVGLATAAAAQGIPALGLFVLAISRVAAVIKVAQLAQAERDKGAQQGAALDSQRANALDSLASAHQGVVDAQQRLADAQEKLNDARREGVRTLTDMLLAEQRATLAARSSQLGLAAQIATGGGTGLLQSALLQSRGDTIAANRQRVDTGRAQAGGVEGLPAVVAARRGVSDAARGVADARKQVEQAQRSLDSASQKMGAAATAYETALGKLSKVERDVLLPSIEAFRKLFDAGSRIRGISDIITRSFAGALDRVRHLLQDPAILGAFTRLADAIARDVTRMARFLTTGPMRDALAFFTNEASRNIGMVGSIFRSLLTIFADVARAASGPLRSAFGAVSNFFRNIAHYTSSQGGQNAMAKFFTDAMRPLGAFLRLLGAIFNLFLALAGPGGASDEGTRGIEGLTRSINRATEYVRHHGEQVRQFFHDAIDATGHVLRVFVALGEALVRTFDVESVRQFSDFLIKVVIPIAASFVVVLGYIVRALLSFANSGVGHFLIQVAAGFLGLRLAVSKVITVLGWLANAFVALLEMSPLGWALTVVAALVLLYVKVKWFRDFVNSVVNFIRDHWKLIIPGFLGPLGTLAAGIGAALSPLKSAFESIKGWAGGALHSIKNFFSGANHELESSGKTFAGKLRDTGASIAAEAEYLKQMQNIRAGNVRQIRDSGVQSNANRQRAAKPKSPFDSLDAYESKLTPEEAKQIKTLWTEIAGVVDKQTDRIAKAVRDMRMGIETTLDRLARIANERFNDFWGSGNTAFDRLEASIEDSMRKIVRSITGAMDDISRAVYEGFSYVVDATNQSLKAFDATPVRVSISPPSRNERHADGGWVGRSGERGKDAVPTVLGRGEAVLNWTQQRLVEPAMHAMYGFGLTDLFRRTRGYHAGGAEQPGLAGGGLTGPFGSGAGFTPVANFAKRKFGLTMTAGRTNHNFLTSTGNVSDHSWGGAGDFSNGVLTPQEDAFNAFWKQKLPQVIKQLIWRGKDQFRGFPISDHEDHVHVALLRQYAMDADRMARLLSRAERGLSVESLLRGASLDGGTEVDHISAPRVRGSGAGQRLLAKVASRITNAANRFIDRQAGADRGNIRGAGGNDILDLIAGGSGTTVGASMFGGPSDPGTGHIGYRGDDLNVHPDSFAELDMGTALGNLPYMQALKVTGPKGALKLYKRDIGRGGGPVSGKKRAIDLWYRAAQALGINGLGLVKVARAAVGGFMDWGGFQANGGDYVVNRPTMFVAGENGPERATFKPMAKGGHVTDPVDVYKAGLERIPGFAEVNPITALIARVNRATARLSTRTNKTLDVLAKALDFLSSDNGPLAILEQRIANRARQATTRLTNAVYGRGRRSDLTSDQIAGREIDILGDQRSGYQQERRLVNSQLAQARRGLRNARTPEQRRLFRGEISRLLGQRADVSERLANNAQALVDRREQRQSDNLADANAAFDRSRGIGSVFAGFGVEARRRLNTAFGRDADNIGLYDKQINVNQNQITDLTTRLTKARRSGNRQLAQQIEDQITELTISVQELAQQKLKDMASLIESEGQKRETNIGRNFRIGELLGISGTAQGKNNALANSYRTQIDQYNALINQAVAAGNTNFADELRGKVQDLQNSIVELSVATLQANIDEINRNADRRDAGIALQGRLADLITRGGDALGGIRAQGAVLRAQGSSILQRRNDLYGQLAVAQSPLGDQTHIDALKDQLNELEVQLQENAQAIKDNTFATRKLSVDIINTGATRATSLIGQGGNILNTLATMAGESTTSAQTATLQATGNVLATQFRGIIGQFTQSIASGEFGATGGGFLSQLMQAAQQGPSAFATMLQALAPQIASFESTLGPEALSAFQGLVDGLTNNETATVENTAALQNLNDSVSQTFTSTAWQTFRQAIFDGNGGLLPQYDIPQMATGGYITRSGLFQLHAGEKVTPANMVDSHSIGEVNVNITNPTETADPDYIGKRIAWEISGSGRK